VARAYARESLSVLGSADPNQGIDFVDQALQNIGREAQAIHALGRVSNGGKAVAGNFIPERVVSFQTYYDCLVAETCFEVLLTAGLDRGFGYLVWRWLLGNSL
jgi:hypothetical protein